MKTNTLKTSPSIFHFRWSSLHDRQPLTCPLPFLFSHSVSPFSLFFPHLAQAGLLCLAAGCPPDCTAAALRSLCRHACFYEVPRQNPELRVLGRHSIIPKLNLTSRERLIYSHTSVPYLSVKVILTQQRLEALELPCLDVELSSTEVNSTEQFTICAFILLEPRNHGS